MSEDKPRYNPLSHLTKLKSRTAGAAPVDYLPVAERVRWFRDEHPDGDIDTTVIEVSDTRAVMLVRVSIPNGGSATNVGSEHKAAFPDYIEKAATVALGRALAILGYGVGFTDEFAENRKEEADKRDYEIDQANVVRTKPTGKRFMPPETNGGFAPPAVPDPVVEKWLADFVDGIGMSNPTGWAAAKATEAFNKAGANLVARLSIPPNTARAILCRLHLAQSGQTADIKAIGDVIDSRIVRAINQADAETLEMLRRLAGGLM